VSRPAGSVWVDPDGVRSVGDAYADHLTRFDSYLRQLAGLRTRFAPAWGDDELGTQFQTTFDQTLDVVEAIIIRVRASVEYAAVGLRLSGDGYEQANDDADLAGRTIAEVFGALPGRYPPRSPRGGDDGEERQYEQMRLAARVGGHAEDGLIPTEPAPMRQGISPFREYDTTGVLIDGEPIPPGYRLQTLGTLPDGTSRADLNHYDSIIPLGDRTVAGPTGPLDGQGDQFFLVKPNDSPGVDPSAPDYRPLLVSFRPDGSAVPLLVDPS